MYYFRQFNACREREIICIPFSYGMTADRRWRDGVLPHNISHLPRPNSQFAIPPYLQTLLVRIHFFCSTRLAMLVDNKCVCFISGSAGNHHYHKHFIAHIEETFPLSVVTGIAYNRIKSPCPNGICSCQPGHTWRNRSNTVRSWNVKITRLSFPRPLMFNYCRRRILDKYTFYRQPFSSFNINKTPLLTVNCCDLNTYILYNSHMSKWRYNSNVDFMPALLLVRFPKWIKPMITVVQQSYTFFILTVTCHSWNQVAHFAKVNDAFQLFCRKRRKWNSPVFLG